MKILFVGYHNPRFISFTEYIERAITSLGHTLEVFDFRDWRIPARIRQRVPALHSRDMRRINRDLIRRVEKFRPDLLIVNGGWTIFPETVSEIRSSFKVITVNWIADFPLMFNDYLRNGPYYDYFFTCGTDALNKYREAGNKNGYWLPFACDPAIHKPIDLSAEEKKKYACDICFVGSNYTERVEILEKLTDFDLGIWGIGWKRIPKNSPLGSSIRGGVVTPDEWVKIFSASKMVLNIIGHRCDVMEPYVDEKDFRMTNTKVFEILGCGAFQLVDAKADVMTLFEDKKHLVCYRNADELIDLIKSYLADPGQRKMVAGEGRTEVLKKHTYRHRIEEILSIISRKA